MAVVLSFVVLAAQGWVAEVERAMATAGIPHAENVLAMAPSPAIESFAHEAALGIGDPATRARKIYDAILALKKSGAIAADRDNTPKERPPKTAAQVMEVVRKGTGDRKAGCYELSALYVAVARSAGLDAVGVERDEPEGTGQIGHVMAGVRAHAGAPLAIFDLQNETTAAPRQVRELDDLEMAAHHYNHLAVAAFLRGEMAAAERAIDLALRLAPQSPSFHNNRATVLAGRGESALALAEALHAAELAPDVPLFRYQVGRLYLASGDLAAAIASLSDALALRPRYAVARRDRGWAYLMTGQADAAEAELTQALRDAHDTPDGNLYLALFYVARERADEARAAVKVGLARNQEDKRLRALDRMLKGDGARDAESRRLRHVLEGVARAQGQRLALP